MTEASPGVCLQMCPQEGLLQLRGWMLRYSQAGTAGVRSLSLLTSQAVPWFSVIYPPALEPNMFS